MKNFTLKIALLILGVGLASGAMAQRVGGVVKDATGNPIIGASVVVDGTTLGVSSGVSGDWTLDVPQASQKTLVISYIGMKTQRIEIGNRTHFDIVLEDELTALDDVVVVGYATVKRRDVVGSVSSVDAEALTQMPVASVAEAMTGRMAGVNISTSEGDPDASIKIRVRGGGSISQDNSPLFIVDGFPVESISDIPASDIQSIDVLKDAFSTAIYGSRGANGVVIVTTKSGEKGRVTVNYNAYVGFKNIAGKNKLATMNVPDFVKYQYEIASLRDDVEKMYEPFFGSFSDIDLYNNVKGNDWMDQLFGRTGTQFSHNLTVAGGGEKFRWTASYAHIDDKAIMIGSDFKRNNLNLKANFKANKKVSFDFSVRYSDTEVRGAGANSLTDAGSSTTGRLRNAILYTPIPVKGQTAEVDDPENSSDAVKPLDAVYDNDKLRNRTQWTANAGFSWEIVKNLKLKVEAGLENYTQIDHEYYGPTSYHSREKTSAEKGTPSVRYANMDRKRLRNTNTLAYDFKDVFTNDDHHFNLLLGQEYIITRANTFQTLVDGFPADFTADKAWKVMASGSNVVYSQNTYAPDDKLFSFFGRLNYDYKSKYFVSATMRADGSSRFSKGGKWGYFPSAALSWRISGEDWMQDVRWIDNLKLRYSFGSAGNNNIPSGVSRNQTFAAGTETIYVNGMDVFWTAGDIMANNDLTWETTYSHNFGLDYSFWNGRLNGSLEIYQNNTTDLLIKMPVQGSGYRYQFRNAGETRNRGIEFSLNAALVQKKNYGLNFAANIAFNQNRVMDLAELNEMGFGVNSGWNSYITMEDYIAVVGGAVGDVQGYKTLGRYEVADFDLDHYAATGEWKTLDGTSSTSVTGVATRPGSLKLACDEEGNPIYGVIGNVQPKFTGGFSLSGYAYGFDFAANFTYSYGNKVYNANRVEYTACHNNYTTGKIRNLFSEMSLGSRWTYVNWNTGELMTDPAELAAANASTKMWSPYITNTFMHSWALEDASFLRLSSLTLGYTLPEKWTRRICVDKIRIYATGTNLFCWTPYTGADPEVDTRRATPMTPNVDYSGYPKSRSWVFGVNLSF